MSIGPKTLAKAVYGRLPFKPLVFGWLRRMGLSRRIYQHLHFHGPFTVDVDDGMSFRMMAHGDILENELFWGGFGGSWEQVAVKAWRLLSETSTGHILDVGANTGAYCLASRACNRSVAIVAFEPVARTAKRLRDNIDLNGFDILVEGKAVSDKSGTVMLHDAPGANNYTASLEAGHGANTTSYAVEAIALDDYLEAKGWPKVSLIKLDVETHEPAAMRGMIETIRRSRPAILLEVLDLEAGREIAAIVDGLGYGMFNIDEDDGLIPATSLKPLSGDNWNNLLCTGQQFERAGLARLLAAARAAPAIPAGKAFEVGGNASPS
jgi:FkbM family methyltransferase